ncbi:hypothetical protein GUJ93_ZPchr0012g20699 [Zizania palustris]|uniref:Uncharacterized protein n=1 Tax=Zizania palustris TaxID=103762 RepID=A0A8J5WR08_ZIZPA|nr:hypothetical protein GUJ93_ZPchr0012g20699 [Zizania palustris]
MAAASRSTPQRDGAVHDGQIDLQTTHVGVAAACGASHIPFTTDFTLNNLDGTVLPFFMTSCSATAE